MWEGKVEMRGKEKEAVWEGKVGVRRKQREREGEVGGGDYRGSARLYAYV